MDSQNLSIRSEYQDTWFHAASWQDAVQTAVSGTATVRKNDDSLSGHAFPTGGDFKIATMDDLRQITGNDLSGSESSDLKVIALEDSYGSIDRDYDDFWWTVTVEKAPTVSITLLEDGSEEPANPYDDAHTPKRLRFHLSRTGSTEDALMVTIESGGGTATEGVDYEYLPASIEIPAGQSYVDFEVTPIWDDIDEGDETVIIKLKPTVDNSGGTQLLSQLMTMQLMQGDDFAADESNDEAEGKIADELWGKIRSRAEQEEGRRLTAYEDTEGYITVGVGRNMGPVGTDQGKASFEQVTGADFNLVKAGQQDLTNQQVDALLDYDLRQALQNSQTEITTFHKLPMPAKEVVVDMIFNMGSLTKFNDLKAALAEGNYRQAAWDIGHKTRDQDSPPSAYSTQVPNRAQRNIDMMNGLADELNQPKLFGNWPAD